MDCKCGLPTVGWPDRDRWPLLPGLDKHRFCKVCWCELVRDRRPQITYGDEDGLCVDVEWIAPITATAMQIEDHFITMNLGDQSIRRKGVLSSFIKLRGVCT